MASSAAQRSCSFHNVALSPQKNYTHLKTRYIFRLRVVTLLYNREHFKNKSSSIFICVYYSYCVDTESVIRCLYTQYLIPYVALSSGIPVQH